MRGCPLYNRFNEQLQYSYDPAGNLTNRANNALIQNFQVNSLNELTTNTNSGTLTVVGTTSTQNTNTVTVNGSNALVYGDATFAATNMPLTTTYTAVAQDGYGRQATNTVTVSLGTNVAFQYDANGNLTNDGLRSFAYDDENQLIQVWVTGNWMSQFSYDGKMRRRIRQEFAWQGSSWVQTNAMYYVYDGNLAIQERDINNLPTTSYTRGKDLSGSLEGAGGIGGLLARTAQSYVDAPLAGHSFYHADGNGNITMLINSQQAVVAKYLYDAFGNVLSASGLLANANVYRFSSKEVHLNSGLAYYLYRYYDPNLQRWLNRDPIREDGGVNLYGFVGNDPLDRIDLLGLENVQIVVTTIIRPPDVEAGVKTIQSVVVNNSGIVSTNLFVGPTPVLGYPVSGIASFDQKASASGCCDVFVTVSGDAHSALLPAFFDIDYFFAIQLNLCKRTGTLSGHNDKYPSYVVRVGGKTVVDFQQQGPFYNTFGLGNVSESKSFNF